MTIHDVRNALGKRVHYRNDRMFIDTDYIFRAYVIRAVNGKAVEQAELTDLCGNSVIIVPLADVELKG